MGDLAPSILEKDQLIKGLGMLNSKLRSCVPKKRVPATMQDSQDDDAFLVTLHEVDNP